MILVTTFNQKIASFISGANGNDFYHLSAIFYFYNNHKKINFY